MFLSLSFFFCFFDLEAKEGREVKKGKKGKKGGEIKRGRKRDKERERKKKAPPKILENKGLVMFICF